MFQGTRLTSIPYIIAQCAHQKKAVQNVALKILEGDMDGVEKECDYLFIYLLFPTNSLFRNLLNLNHLHI